MIRPEQMVALFLKACPGFRPVWTRHVVQAMNGNGQFSHHSPVAELVGSYLLGHVRRNYFREIPAAFFVIETLLTEGDEETRLLVENEILVPLQEHGSRSPRTATVRDEWFGPRTQAVWQVIGRAQAEEEQSEAEQTEQAQPLVMQGYSFAEARPLYAAFGLIGGGPTGLTYMGIGGGENLISLGTLLLIWIGLSLVERFQRTRLRGQEQSSESMENAGEGDVPNSDKIKKLWTLIDGASGILLVLGLPICLSIVLGHKIFLDSSLLDLLIVVVGLAVVVAVLFRDRLWKQGPNSNNTPRSSSPGTGKNSQEPVQKKQLTGTKDGILSREGLAT